MNTVRNHVTFIIEIEDPESIIISVVFPSSLPLTMAPCDLTAAIINLETSHL